KSMFTKKSVIAPTPLVTRRILTGGGHRRRGNRCLSVLLLLLVFVATAADASRIKDVASIEGVRENQLIGYGLVTGLRTTGDSVVGAPFTIQSLISMLKRMGVNLTLDPKQITAKNVAAVIVTAKLP